jgi:LemA protein
MGAIIVLAVPVIAAVVVVGLYNSMATLRIRTQEAWSGIDTQLKRRYDLIPNLVETVKGYAKHEKEAFENVSRLSAAALGARTVGERATAEAGLAESLKTVFAVAEAYPELKASDNFKDLQKNLSEIEDALQNSRRYYNAVVRDYNTAQATFPGNLMAGPFGFTPAEFFQIAEGEKAVPKVSFS